MPSSGYSAIGLKPDISGRYMLRTVRLDIKPLLQDTYNIARQLREQNNRKYSKADEQDKSSMG